MTFVLAPVIHATPLSSISMCVVAWRSCCRAEQSFDARQELHHRERLFEIVVRTKLEPHHSIDYRSASGEHDNRCVDSSLAKIAAGFPRPTPPLKSRFHLFPLRGRFAAWRGWFLEAARYPSPWPS